MIKEIAYTIYTEISKLAMQFQMEHVMYRPDIQAFFLLDLFK